jgi:hypothetical protein
VGSIVTANLTLVGRILAARMKLAHKGLQGNRIYLTILYLIVWLDPRAAGRVSVGIPEKNNQPGSLI